MTLLLLLLIYIIIGFVMVIFFLFKENTEEEFIKIDLEDFGFLLLGVAIWPIVFAFGIMDGFWERVARMIRSLFKNLRFKNPYYKPKNQNK